MEGQTWGHYRAHDQRKWDRLQQDRGQLCRWWRHGGKETEQDKGRDMRGGRKETFKKIFRLCCWQSERADKTYKKKRKIYNLLVVLICSHFKHSLVRGSREVKALIETNAKWSWSGFTSKTRFLISFSMWNPLWCDFKKGEIITFFTITWKCHREMT